jgi:drug/metabolite transporter (DMT)-like permease
MAAWPLYTVLGRRAAMRNIPPLVAVTVVVYTGMLALLPVAIGHAAELLHVPLRVWAAIAYLAIVGTVVNWAAYYWAVGQVGPKAAAPFANLVPVWTLAITGPFRHEWPTPWQIVGAAAVVGGIAWGRAPIKGEQGRKGSAPTNA